MALVLGCGIGGLTSAYYSRSPTVLVEAKRELGGRVKSVDFAGERVDVGAQFISSEDKNAMALVRDLNLRKQLKRFGLSDFTVFYEEHAKLDSKTVLEISKIETTEIVELAKFIEGLDEKLERQYEELAFSTFSEWYSTEFGGEMKWFVDSLCRTVTFVDSSRLSALYGLVVVASFFENAYGLQGGLESVIKRLYSELLKRESFVLKKNSPVSSLICRDGLVNSIAFEAKELSVSENLISSVPAYVLADFLADVKSARNALLKIKYASCGVVLFKTNVDLLNGKMGVLLVNEPVSAVVDAHGKIGEPNSGILVALLPSAKKTGLVELAEKTLAKEIPGFESHVEESFSYFWPAGLPVCSPGLFAVQQEILETIPKNLKIAADFMGLPSLDASIETARKSVL